MAITELDLSLQGEIPASPEQQGFRDNVRKNIAAHDHLFDDFPPLLFVGSESTHPAAQALRAVDAFIGNPTADSEIVLTVKDAGEPVETRARLQFLRALSIGPNTGQGNPDTRDDYDENTIDELRLLHTFYQNVALIERARRDRYSGDLLEVTYICASNTGGR